MKNKPFKILFVCLGNICRSPAAQGIMQDIVDSAGRTDDFVIDSAGTYGGHAGQLPDPRMRAHAIRRGLNLTHRARRVSESDFDRFDLIVAMDNSNYDDLRYLAPTPEAQAKVVRMADYLTAHPGHDHIPDPYYDGAQGFENVLDLLQDACSSLFLKLTK